VAVRVPGLCPRSQLKCCCSLSLQLLDSENYVTRRQSLKLLGELLLDRANFSIMTRYISHPENLKVLSKKKKKKNSPACTLTQPFLLFSFFLSFFLLWCSS
jgi:hypothetical protein